MSERAAARHFGVSRESVRKMLAFSVPPGYRRTAPVRRPKLDGFTGLKQSIIATLGRLDKLTASGAIDQLLRSAARFSDRSRRSSSSSPVLTPSRTPASTSNWRTQLRTTDSVKSRSRATSPIERGPSLTSLNVSSLNSFENFRLFRVMVVTSEAIIASYQVSTKPGQRHR